MRMKHTHTLQHYLITDPQYYTNEIKQFESILRLTLKNKQVDMACFRDKISSNYEILATIFVTICRELNIKHILLNENLALATQLQCGIHLTSTQFDKIKEAKKKGLYTVISCHSHEEIQKAQQAGANAVTYSPIFATPNKGAPKGIAALEESLKLFDIPIIALGGIIHDQQVQQIEKTKAYGFASIRYFLEVN